jgi:hypothetical protein
MKELIDLSFSSPHLPITVLLLVILLYWFTVILGVLDFSFLDFDADVDVHADVSADVHLDKNIHVDVKPKRGIFAHLLAFFNLGKVPFMVWMSFLILFVWCGSILSNYYLNNESVGFALILLVPNLIISLLLTKLLTAPLVRVFSDGKNEFERNTDLIGKPCTVLLSANEMKVGQAEVLSATGVPVLLTVKTTEGKPLRRGEKGLVIDYDAASHTFLIAPFEH